MPPLARGGSLFSVLAVYGELLPEIQNFCGCRFVNHTLIRCDALNTPNTLVMLVMLVMLDMTSMTRETLEKAEAEERRTLKGKHGQRTLKGKHGTQNMERRTFGVGAPLAALPSLACRYGALGEAEHVGALGVLGAASPFLGRQCAIGVYLSFESLEERFTCWSGACAPVVGAAPRDLRRDAAVDVLSDGYHLPSVTVRGLVSRLVSAVDFRRCAGSGEQETEDERDERVPDAQAHVAVSDEDD